LSLDLKELRLSHERIETGRLFQSSGAETAKAREPCNAKGSQSKRVEKKRKERGNKQN